MQQKKRVSLPEGGLTLFFKACGQSAITPPGWLDFPPSVFAASKVRLEFRVRMVQAARTVGQGGEAMSSRPLAHRSPPPLTLSEREER